jgi:hypothetical protein
MKGLYLLDSRGAGDWKLGGQRRGRYGTLWQTIACLESFSRLVHDNRSINTTVTDRCHLLSPVSTNVRTCNTVSLPITMFFLFFATIVFAVRDNGT